MDSQSEQFSKIYDQYINKIYRFVYLKVDSQETAEDITSKVFLRGWEVFKADSGAIKNPGAFLYQIARNNVVDHYRAKGRTQVIPDIVPQLSDPGANAHEVAILGSDLEVVKKAMQGLKKEYQDVIIWHYLEDLPIPEVAKLAGKTEGAVRVTLHRGLEELKSVINKQVQTS
jgi:RNA polymerase sigma-70 factor (ECF subfamily)